MGDCKGDGNVQQAVAGGNLVQVHRTAVVVGSYLLVVCALPWWVVASSSRGTCSVCAASEKGTCVTGQWVAPGCCRARDIPLNVHAALAIMRGPQAPVRIIREQVYHDAGSNRHTC
jgi:hypothetical protein